MIYGLDNKLNLDRGPNSRLCQTRLQSVATPSILTYPKELIPYQPLKIVFSMSSCEHMLTFQKVFPNVFKSQVIHRAVVTVNLVGKSLNICYNVCNECNMCNESSLSVGTTRSCRCEPKVTSDSI